jgi:UDP-N-acetylglucosamine:LPS N-acetylglucosamine transferase
VAGAAGQPLRGAGPEGVFTRVTGLAPEDLYNKRLASGFTLGLAQELKLLQGMIRLGHAPMVQRLQQHWLRSEPDLVVSLVPNFNRVLYQSLAGALPGVPYVTVMTDLADHPPNFWIEPGQRQHFVCGTDRALAQARAAGHDAGRIHRASGMILRPEFHRSEPFDRGAERRALGLENGRPVGVVLFGGHGSNVMARIAERLPETPLILLCGHNRALAEQLRAQPPGAARRVVLDYTPDVARWMRLADFFIGKPGPGSLSEAVCCGLPVIVTRNAWTMPQERWNTEWVREQGIGLVLESFRPIREAVAELGARLPALRANVRRIDNRAVFELPDILARILAEAETAVMPSPDCRRPVTAGT